MSTYITRLLVLMAFPLLALSCSREEGQASQAKESSPTVADSVEIRTEKMQQLASTIRKCSRLYATEYHIHKIITHDDELKLKGSVLGFDYNLKLPVGSRSIAIPMDAVVKCFVDLGQFGTEQVDYNDNRLTITLPDPQIELTSTRINHDEVQSYVALLRSDFTDKELSGFEKEGRKLILQSLPKNQLVERTRTNLTKILTPMLARLDLQVDAITITFRKDLTPEHLKVITN